MLHIFWLCTEAVKSPTIPMSSLLIIVYSDSSFEAIIKSRCSQLEHEDSELQAENLVLK